MWRWLVIAVLAFGGCKDKKSGSLEGPELGSKLPPGLNGVELGMSEDQVREMTGLSPGGGLVGPANHKALLAHLTDSEEARSRLGACLPREMSVEWRFGPSGLRAASFKTRSVCPGNKVMEIVADKARDHYGGRHAEMASVGPSNDAGMAWDEKRGVEVELMVIEGFFNLRVGELSDWRRGPPPTPATAAP